MSKQDFIPSVPEEVEEKLPRSDPNRCTPRTWADIFDDINWDDYEEEENEELISESSDDDDVAFIPTLTRDVSIRAMLKRRHGIERNNALVIEINFPPTLARLDQRVSRWLSKGDHKPLIDVEWPVLLEQFWRLSDFTHLIDLRETLLLAVNDDLCDIVISYILGVPKMIGVCCFSVLGECTGKTVPYDRDYYDGDGVWSHGMFNTTHRAWLPIRRVIPICNYPLIIGGCAPQDVQDSDVITFLDSVIAWHGAFGPSSVSGIVARDQEFFRGRLPDFYRLEGKRMLTLECSRELHSGIVAHVQRSTLLRTALLREPVAPTNEV